MMYWYTVHGTCIREEKVFKVFLGASMFYSMSNLSVFHVVWSLEYKIAHKNLIFPVNYFQCLQSERTLRRM